MRVETVRAAGARRSAFGCGAAFAIGLTVFLVVSLVSAALFYVMPGGSTTLPVFIHAQPGSVRWNTRDRLNILLMGVDGPVYQPAHTDMLMLASFDPGSRGVALLSIPSNLWVTIPGYGPAPIDETYADGGARLTLRVVESVTHVPIPYYAAVGPDAVRQGIDALGGVSVDVPATMQLPTDSTADSARGLQHLNGAAAYEFMRLTNPDPGGDEGRMHRQQQLLLALKNQVLQPQTFVQIPAIVNTVGGSIATNLPYDQIPSLAHALLSVPPSHLHQAYLDQEDDTVSAYQSGGEQVLLPDWEHIRALAQRLFPDTMLRRGGKVEVLNGSGLGGQAAGLAAWLQQAGVSIQGYGSASSFDYPHTVITLEKGSHPSVAYVARAVAALLQVPIVTRSGGASSAPIVVIIGRDYQDPSQQ